MKRKINKLFKMFHLKGKSLTYNLRCLKSAPGILVNNTLNIITCWNIEIILF